MKNGEPFSCILIGEESLLIQCAETLLQKNHSIKGVITAAAPLITWAASQQIPVIDPKADLASVLGQEPFEYLFSITNLAIIPEAVLALPRLGAVNFHDGPLPRYAGLNAPTWALANRETEHGITWHTMTAVVDEGEILKQKLFPIAPDETAFTLNVKCFQAGMETFAGLVDELAAGTIQPRRQNLAEKTYFGKTHRPRQTAVLDWTLPAADLDALVRALDFGAYTNPIALPEIWTGDAVWLAAETAVLSETSDAPPGTILKAGEYGLVVAAGGGSLHIKQLLTFAGTAVFPAQAGLSAGQILPAPDWERLTSLTKLISRQEPFWLRRLAGLIPPEIPYAHRRSEAGRWKTAAVTLPEAATKHLAALAGERDLGPFFIAAVAAYLARLSGQYQFSLNFTHPGLADLLAGVPSLYADHIPLAVSLSPDERAGDNLVQLADQTAGLIAKRLTFSRNLPLRYPHLSHLRSQDGRALLPVTLALTADPSAYIPQPGTEMAILLSPDGRSCTWRYDPAVYDAPAIAAMQAQLSIFLANLTVGLELARIPILDKQELDRQLIEWNETAAAYPEDLCLHDLFELQAARTPADTAVIFHNRLLSYQELNERANKLARHLRRRGVGPESRVGVFMARGWEMIVGLLGILKAGGAYLPLDPEYPADRLAFMAADAGVSLFLTQERLAPFLPPHQAEVVRIDADWPEIDEELPDTPASYALPDSLAYIIYTSGSTGQPKGVMVEHRNVLNFLAGMDERIPVRGIGTWLTVTSLSFDISVLEIFWSLTRGLRLVVYDGHSLPETAVAPDKAHRPIDFSLFYFASDEGEAGVADKYHLLLEGAKYGDENGFSAVWTPERHFHAFGGLYPNPSVAGAAIAAVTQHVRIRAGSCVLPLHSPIRVAEEWALVDNLSRGRVDISFAAGWQPNDFVLRPGYYADRKEIMFRDIETVRKLWRGETLTMTNDLGREVAVRTLPRPVQPELPVWITAAGNPETFRMAGERGFHILTHLLGQSVAELAGKIAIYRTAWHEAGHAGEGHVTLMLHTFIGEDEDKVREIVRGPMIEYLKSAMGLVRAAAWHFPTFKQRAAETGQSPLALFDSEDLTEEDRTAVLNFAFERYFEQSGLFGTPQTALNMVHKLKGIEVDEIACLIDFGVPSAQVMAHLPAVKQVMDMARENGDEADFSIPALIRRYKVTHFQCTPSQSAMLLMDEANRDAYGRLHAWMVGGEAFPAALAREIKSLLPGGLLLNMYGPTETTIWSATERVDAVAADSVPIGRPIANTFIYLLDAHGQPVPTGLPGELFIGGDGVVRGYHDRPDLNEARFLSDPFRQVPEARMYRTGDLARWLADGRLQFLGRSDFQVKIRGYRIELGEIETHLQQHTAVREAAVMAREDVPGDKRLVAYYTGQNTEAANLRQHLQVHLPDFMLPAHYIHMDAFPLTPNKKTDRRALPAPDQADVKPTAAYQPPTNELEQTIADIWKELLNVPQVGLNDNFFDLGGHSLLTVQAHRRLRQATGHEIAITDLFRYPTIRALSRHLTQDGKNGSGSGQRETAVSAGLDRAAARRARMRRRNN